MQYYNPEIVSNCCGAEMFDDCDICPDCGEHCEAEEVDEEEEEEEDLSPDSVKTRGGKMIHPFEDYPNSEWYIMLQQQEQKREAGAKQRMEASNIALSNFWEGENEEEHPELSVSEG